MCSFVPAGTLEANRLGREDGEGQARVGASAGRAETRPTAKPEAPCSALPPPAQAQGATALLQARCASLAGPGTLHPLRGLRSPRGPVRAPGQERGAGRAAPWSRSGCSPRPTPHGCSSLRSEASPGTGLWRHAWPLPPIPLKQGLRLADDPVPCPARVEKSRRCSLSGDKRPPRSGSSGLGRCAFRTRLHLCRASGSRWKCRGRGGS